MNILGRVNSPDDLKKLNMRELKEYAEEVRQFLINSVSKTGGHLASNLGVVELTIALHYVFDCPKDKLVWDVGHQSYVHKIITGRIDLFDTLRRLGGISGFPKTSESPYDCYNTGHSSTSISAALGMAHARDLNNENYNVVSIIGDGALTGGMALEALSDAGHSQTKMIIILNDNQMSISKNVGGISIHLSNIRSAAIYNKFRKKVMDTLENTPGLRSFIKHLKDSLKYTVIPHTIFEDVGFRYLGPFDGHNLFGLIKLLKRVKDFREPLVIHITTIKGKGYNPAELNPGVFHGVSHFDVETGIFDDKKQDYSFIFGEKLSELAEVNNKITAISAAMTSGTGLESFVRKFPDRFFDVGIAEQHAVSMAGGMATAGFTPVFAVYSSFLQRAYDQVLHDIGLQNLHVVFGVDRAGIVGEDGETHHGIYDLSYLSHIPNMTIMAPSCFSELCRMLEYAVNVHNGPIAVRYPRGSEEYPIPHNTPVTYGKGELLRNGNDVLLLAAGDMVAKAIDTASILDNIGISAAVIDLRFIKPVDTKILFSNITSKRLVVTMEDNVISGGMGENVLRILSKNHSKIPVLNFGFNGEPVVHGKVMELFDLYGLTPEKMAFRICEELKSV